MTASRPSGAQHRRSCLLASVTAQSSSAPPPPPRPPSLRRRRGLSHFSNRILGLLLRRNACAIWVGGLDRARGARSRGDKTTGRGFGTRAHAPVLAWSRAFAGGSWSRWALLGFVGSYPGFIGFYRVLSTSGFIGFYLALVGFGGFGWVLVGAPRKRPGFSWVSFFYKRNPRPIPQNGLPKPSAPKTPRFCWVSFFTSKTHAPYHKTDFPIPKREQHHSIFSLYLGGDRTFLYQRGDRTFFL